MATRKSSSKKTNVREIVLIFIILVLIAALLASLFAADEIKSILGLSGNAQNESGEDGVVYTSVLSGKANVVLPSEFDGENCVEVHFIDIGQGDAIAVMLPDGKTFLIDAGSGTSVSAATRTEYMDYLSDILAIDVVDYLLVTHPDSDHVNLASGVLEEYDVKNIYYNEYYTEGSKTYKTFMDDADAEAETGATLYEIGAEEEKYTVTGDGYEFEIFAPGNTGFEGAESAKNSMSIMCVLTYGGRTVLFTGDAEVETEEWFISLPEVADLDVDVLKVGHHGSESCTSQAFMEAIKPEYALISCDNGTAYGHPHAVTMNTLFAFGTVTYRTNRHGNVVLYLDDDGDFGFLPENDVPVENNRLGINPLTITLQKAA